MEENNQTVDITRFNRKDRRRLKPQIGVMLQGRNLPFEKKLHKTVANFNEMRLKEIEDEHSTKEDGN
jgi:hypothetical protein